MAARAEELTRDELKQLRDVTHSPREWISRATVLDEKKRTRKLHPLWPEQEAWIEALCTRKYILGLKCRQVGFTTLTCAYFTWKTFTSPYARTVLQMVHEDTTQQRLADMLKLFWAKTPALLRKPMFRHNIGETLLGSDEDPQGAFVRLVAGGRGQGRGVTATDIHATEMSKWPMGSASTSRATGQTADEEVFSSAQSTIHEGSDGQVVVESTGNGPRGLLYDMYQIAKVDPEWALVFVPWTASPRYQRPVANRKDFESELDRDEVKLLKHGLTLEQINWRRHKIRTQKYTRLTFRLEFPLTDDEPFLLDESGWFNQDAITSLHRLARGAGVGNPDWPNEKESLRVFHRAERRRRYYIGCDTSGGTGGDEAVIIVLRDDGLVVAIWSSNRADPSEQAYMLSTLGGLYTTQEGKPLACTEANNFGDSVIRAVSQLGGVVLWKSDKGKDFTSTGANSGAYKRLAYVHAREMIDAELVVVNDIETCRQLQKIVEKPGGKIEGSGSSHDDRAMALVLALWAMRGYSTQASSTIDPEKERIERILQANARWGGQTR